MSKIIVYIFSLFSLLFGCNLNKHRFPPKEYFSGELVPIAIAIYNDESREVKRYIKKGIDVNSVGKEKGYSLLLYALTVENKSVVKQLLRLGANPNQMCETIVENSQEKGTYYIANRYPLSDATYMGDLSYAKMLLEYGADATMGFPMHVAILNCPYNSKKKMIQLMLDHGADINKQNSGGETPVVKAAAASVYEIVNYLLDLGADPMIADNRGKSVMGWLQTRYNFSKDKKEFFCTFKPTIDRLEKLGIQIDFNDSNIKQ